MYWNSSLNPCCNGRWSRTRKRMKYLLLLISLNPCCNGQWSRTSVAEPSMAMTMSVLILVVMDNGLVHNGSNAAELADLLS